MVIWPLLLGVAASLVTLLGGLLTLRARGQLALVTGASAGIVLGVALLDLLPEAAELAGAVLGTAAVVSISLCAGIGYALLGRGLDRVAGDSGRLRRQLGPASLTLHSLIDGAGIGLAFQVSPQTGWVVAAAVIGHDLADGVNIVGLTLGCGDKAMTRRWLAANALAPVIGATVGQLVHLPQAIFVSLLSLLAGIFVSIALGELLPRSLRLGRPLASTVAALTGFAVIAITVHLHG